MNTRSPSFIVIAPSTKPTVKTLLVLLCVENLNAQRSLDIILTATEDASVYTKRINDDDIDSLRHQKSDHSRGSWRGILSWLLLRRDLAVKSADREIVNSVFLEAWVESTSMVISVRQNLHIGTVEEDIEIGQIVLQEDQTKIDEISMFDWATKIAKDNHGLRRDANQLQERIESQKNVIDGLKRQLESLIGERRDHETALLEKARHIINTKKLKIRDQQRLIATVTVDNETGRAISEKRSTRARASAKNLDVAERREKKRSGKERSKAANVDSNDGVIGEVTDRESSDAGGSESDDAFEKVSAVRETTKVAKSQSGKVQGVAEESLETGYTQQSSRFSTRAISMSSENVTDEEL